MTERLYYHDSYLHEFRGNIVATADEGKRVYLDRTAFYPTSGGQPFDVGTLGGVVVREVIDEDDDRIAHILESPLKEGEVEGRVDWTRRYDHMQQHTGQHLLSAVLIELFNIPTVSFHMGSVTSTIDVAAAAMDQKQLERAGERCAEIVGEARPIGITFEDSAAGLGLRKATERTGTLRIVSIPGLDRCGCGGTHVRSTAELGPILTRKLEKIRGNVRIEFVCGMRAIRQARTDFRTLGEISRLVSVPFEETAALVAAQVDKAKALEKTCARLASELAQREGRELYASASPDEAGVRRVTQRATIDDAMRARAQAFVHGLKAVFVAASEQPPSILVAASVDSGVHAGNVVKAAVTAVGGRGGGNQGLGQGSVPSAEALDKVILSIVGQAGLIT
jgi:alanyl-tRNA synthetase